MIPKMLNRYGKNPGKTKIMLLGATSNIYLDIGRLGRHRVFSSGLYIVVHFWKKKLLKKIKRN